LEILLSLKQSFLVVLVQKTSHYCDANLTETTSAAHPPMSIAAPIARKVVFINPEFDNML